MGLLVSTLFISCGKDNKSGGGSNPAIGIDPFGGIANAAGNGTRLPANWLQILANEHPCNPQTTGGVTNNARTIVNVPLNMMGLHVNANNLHVGVTLEGDILVISNNNNTIQAQVHACPRPGMTNGAQLMQQPIVNMSQMCAMGEVSAADIMIPANTNTGYNPYNTYPSYNQNGYHLAFFPVGLAKPSSLCTGGQYPNYYY